jgi:DNA-binding transcriptional MerR regulator
MTPKLYKAADVCEMTHLQPYVLRSWEKEFPGIGVQKSADSARLYRQSDVDQVLRIKQLVFGEGLTLAGARRRLEGQAPAPAVAEADDSAEVLETLGADARARIASVRQGLRVILDALSSAPGTVDVTAVADVYELRPPTVTARPSKATAKAKPRAVATRGKSPRVASKPARRGKTAGAKRKRASA